MIFKHVLFLVFCFVAFASGALASGKQALVIGIGDYDNIRSLRNPVPDAQLAGSAFEQLGFETLVATDLDAEALRAVLLDFNIRSTDADVALIYFAGHGMQVGGENYLLASDAQGASQGAAIDSAISTQELVAAFGDGAGAKILMVDACRDNPFADDTRSLLSREQDGLARINHEVEDLLVVFAAQPGNVALDGSGDNSPFVQAVSNVLTQSDQLSFQDALIDITRQVRETTGDRQTPYIEGTLSFRIVLGDPQIVSVSAELCEGGQQAFGLAALSGGFLELDGTKSSLSFGEQIGVCIRDQSVDVKGPIDATISCEAILESDFNGASYDFLDTSGTPHNLWFYVNPEASEKTLELGVYRDGEQLYWLATQRPFCQS